MGGGFNFLSWYGYYFLKDKTKSDWPHNPFISILLYSGIIGLILYIYLLYKVLLLFKVFEGILYSFYFFSYNILFFIL